MVQHRSGRTRGIGAGHPGLTSINLRRWVENDDEYVNVIENEQPLIGSRGMDRLRSGDDGEPVWHLRVTALVESVVPCQLMYHAGTAGDQN